MNIDISRSVIAIALLPLIACQTAERDLAGGTTRASRDNSSFVHNASADSVLSGGESAYKRGEYDSARVILTSGQRIASLAGDSGGVARALTWLGLTNVLEGDVLSWEQQADRA